MLTEIYIEALLVDEALADQVWEACEAGEISDFWAACRPTCAPKLICANSSREGLKLLSLAMAPLVRSCPKAMAMPQPS